MDIDKVKKQFASKLPMLMKKHGYSQPSLANILGVSSATVHNWLIGRNLPNSETLIEMSELFNVSIDSLVSTTEEVVTIVPGNSAKSRVIKKLQKYLNDKENTTVTTFDDLHESTHFGHKLERIMGYNFMDVDRLAGALLVKPDIVKAWIDETEVPNLTQLIQICDVLHVSMDRLAYSRSPVTCIQNRGLSVKDCDMLRYIADALREIN